MNTADPAAMAFARQMTVGFIVTIMFGVGLLSTAAIPYCKRLAPVMREEIRPAHPTAAIHAVHPVVTGQLTVVNYIHRAISVRGVAADQVYRLFAATIFLIIYSLRILSRNRTVRASLAVFAVAGTAGYVSDVLSYWTVGGVVDWIGVNGRSAFAPSDLCCALAPLGVALSLFLGVLTFRDPSPSREFAPVSPRR